MSDFKIGDRVRVYFGPTAVAGTVTDLGPWGICVRDDDGGLWDVHPKQCRRLKKKERRRVWVSNHTLKGLANEGYSGVGEISTEDEGAEPGHWVEFVEVRKKK